MKTFYEIKTDVNRLSDKILTGNIIKAAKNFSYYLGRSYGLSIISIFQVLIVIRIIPVELYGISQLVGSITGTLMVLTLAGAETSIVQTSKKGYLSMFSFLIHRRILWSILPVIITLIISFISFRQHGQAAVMLALCCGIYPLSCFRMISSHYLGVGNYPKIIAIDGSARLLSCSVAIGSAIMFPTNLLLIFLPAMYVEALVYVFWSIPILKGSKSKSPDELNINFYKSELHYVYKRTMLSFLPSMAARLDRLAIGYLYTYRDLAIFSMARSVLDFLKTVAQAIYNVLFQKYANADEQNFAKSMRRILVVNFIALVIGAVSLDFLATCVIKLFLNQKYGASLPLIHIFLYTGVLTFVANSYQLKWVCTRNVISEALYRIVLAVLNILLLVIFAATFGYRGIIIAAAMKLPSMSLVAVVIDAGKKKIIERNGFGDK